MKDITLTGLYEYMTHMMEELSRLRQDMRLDMTALRTDVYAKIDRLDQKFDDKTDRVYVQLDGIHDMLDRHETERIAQNAQLDRHEKAIISLQHST